MLRQLRSPKLRKVLMIALAVVVIPSFVVVYGWQNGSSGGPGAAPPVAATLKYGPLDKREIGSRDMERGKEMLLGRMGQYAMATGVPVDRGMLNRLISTPPILEEAVNVAILERYAQEHGITATRQEAIQWLQENIPAESKDAQLQQWAAQGQSLSDIADSVRTSLLLEKVRNSIGSRVRPTAYEAWLDYSRDNTKLTLDMARFDLSNFLNKVEVDPKSLEEYFEKNKERYRIPEQVEYNFVLVRKDDLRSSVTVSQDDLTSAYESMKEEFRLPPAAQVRDIFLKKPTGEDSVSTGPNSMEARTAAIRDKAQDVYQRAAKGENFATLADQYSELTDLPPRDDAGTTDSDALTTAGGNLGWISRTVAQNYFADDWTSAVFNAEPGSLLAPIETETGFHIAKVESKREGLLQPLDKVEELVRARVTEQKATPLFEELGEKLRQADEKYPSLEQFARETSLPLSTTPKVGRDEQFIPQIGLLTDFQAELRDLEKGGRTPLLSDANRHFAAEVKEEYPEHLPAFDEVRERVTSEYKQDKAQEMARAAAESLLAKGKDLESFKTAAAEAGSTSTQTRPFTVSEAQTILGPVQNFEETAATLNKGEVRMAPLDVGNSPLGYVVFHVTAKEEPARKEFADELPKILPRLRERKQEIVLNEFLRDRRAELKDNIEVSEYYKQ